MTVDFPEPLGPITARKLALINGEINPIECLKRRLTCTVNLGDVRQFDQ